MPPKLVQNETVAVGPWEIRCTKKPILDSAEMERWEAELQAPCMPEMVFGNNLLSLTFHAPPPDEHSDAVDTTIEFNCRDALGEWSTRAAKTVCVREGTDTDASLVHVAHSNDWSEKRKETVKTMKKKECDWTFTTYYSGTIKLNGELAHKQGDDNALERLCIIRDTSESIPMEKLTRRDPIHVFAETVLFEDEFDDNGTSLVSVKLRVMPTCLFVLQRFFMRVDDVMFRVVDTRIFHDFGKPYVLRQKQVREATFKELEGQLPSDRSSLAQEHLIVPLLPLKSEVNEEIRLDGCPVSSSPSASASPSSPSSPSS
eukprot:TRINITY_DN4221_c1_g2_i2.p1 TRINITY_DN4221_c1_g2~~TRINITY_DN4221_c1_g2_i2.p1  ORF type:complete len:315 (+),score=108.57 TRINITY_DN4221_c1_g2_i2:125-1069(+)